ncbi:MAG TPA: response regulator [Terracidiphilus sp.]|nr:response regulator [Terracidiphilus sp.]
MPKRLLFVDDDAMVLDGLRRALHSMRNEWEMRFVGSGAAALEALDREPFEAIVTDMRMPLMDGAQLLERVKERHCDMVRIVLSGQSEKEAVLRSIAPAHQFLSKPCDVQELKARLAQAFAMRDLLRNPALAAVVSRLRSIPSLPTLYNELSAALASENTSIAEIEQIISRDVGMAAKILQLANSAFLGARGHVSSLSHALSLIGAEIIRSLMLSIHVFSQFDRHSYAAAYIPALWDHSMAVAWLSRRIAASETGSKAVQEESFTTGLLHDVGKIVLLAEMPEEYRRVLERINGGERCYRDWEKEFVGCAHDQIGAYLMAIWGLPESIVHAVGSHHAASGAKEPQFSPLTAVYFADFIASAADSSPLNHDTESDAHPFDAPAFSAKESVWRGFCDEYLLARVG